MTTAVGGSASTDGGIGFLSALGTRMLDASSHELSPVPRSLASVSAIDDSGIEPAVRRCRLAFATDVTSPQTGPDGSAAVLAPPKGATADEIPELDQNRSANRTSALSRHADPDVDSIARGGSADGIAAGARRVLSAVCTGEMISRAESVLRRGGAPAAVEDPDLILVDAGSLDEQSIAGKAPLALSRKASRAAHTVLAVAGRVLLDDATLGMHGISQARSLIDSRRAGEDSRPDAQRIAQRVVALGLKSIIDGLRVKQAT